MHVKLLRNLGARDAGAVGLLPGGASAEGAIVDVAEEAAASLIERGWAAAVSPYTPPVTLRAVPPIGIPPALGPEMDLVAFGGDAAPVECSFRDNVVLAADTGDNAAPADVPTPATTTCRKRRKRGRPSNAERFGTRTIQE